VAVEAWLHASCLQLAVGLDGIPSCHDGYGLVSLHRHGHCFIRGIVQASSILLLVVPVLVKGAIESHALAGGFHQVGRPFNEDSPTIRKQSRADSKHADVDKTSPLRTLLYIAKDPYECLS
jgi:hypothetical protein